MAPTIQQRTRLLLAVKDAEERADRAILRAKTAGVTAAVRHKCFISYHGADIDHVTGFVEKFADVFIPRVVGASDSDHFSDPVTSDDEEYIKKQIGAKYLSDSTVTILFMGSCTWSRKFVDWELASTLRNGSVNKRNGLLGLTPPTNKEHKLPSRFASNYDQNGNSYARYHFYPTTDVQLRGWIEDAFKARSDSSRTDLIKNGDPLRKLNSAC